MKLTNWFNMKEHRPVREGRYQIIVADPAIKWVNDYANARPFYWSFRRNTWYVENPGRRPSRLDGYFTSRAYWRGVSQ